MVLARLACRHRGALLTWQTFSHTSPLSSSSSTPPARLRTSRNDAEGQSKIRGRYQWWKPPVYVSPDTHPLEEGPDFTFCDGRPAPLSTMTQVSRKLEEIELGKRIVQRLSEMREIEAACQERDRLVEKTDKDYLKQKPKAKGKPLTH